MQNSLAIIGAGRVGRALGRRLRELGWKIGAIVTRSEASARKAVRFIGAGKACAGLTRQILVSRVILIATPDDHIAVVARGLARIAEEELRGRVVLHTSGAMDSSALDSVRHRGAKIGSIHPLQSFSGVAVPSLEGKVFAIEGDTQAVRMARRIARALGGSPVHIAGSKKLLYHTAAAMALTRQVLENFERLGPRAAWTGPLSRGDYKVVRAHSNALRESPHEFMHAYEALNRLAARVLSQDSAAMLAELEKNSVDQKAKAKVIGGNA